jgi:hypothetical protein
LPLNLYYLVTAYGAGDAEEKAHALLGQAMLVLHDHCLLGAEEIRNATATDWNESNLHEQVERVRITLQPLTLDEISRLWTGFQTQFRLSATYQASVVLIESERPRRTPLPVLMRGVEDRGVYVAPNLLLPFPAIEGIRGMKMVGAELLAPEARISHELGERLAILGHHFAGPDGDPNNVTVTVTLNNPRLDRPLQLTIPVDKRTDQRIEVVVPNQPANVPAGVYLVSVTVALKAEPRDVHTTNEWPLLISPRLTDVPKDVPLQNLVDGHGEATIAVTCEPAVQPAQRALLLLGDRALEAEARPASSNQLSFKVAGIVRDEYRVRLRVDGVDSRLVDRLNLEKPKFDETQKIRLT